MHAQLLLAHLSSSADDSLVGDRENKKTAFVSNDRSSHEGQKRLLNVCYMFRKLFGIPFWLKCPACCKKDPHSSLATSWALESLVHTEGAILLPWFCDDLFSYYQ